VTATTGALTCGILLSACGPGTSGTRDVRGTSAVAGEITVLAASSLADVFESLASEFEAEHPAAHMRLSFAASPTTVAQVREGAPADVVATADEETMAQLVDSGDVGTPRVFARNELAIAVERGNPRNIESLADLARPGLIVMLCDSSVPCGRLADDALDGAGVTVNPASREQNVRATIAKVDLGEADAAIVYATDTIATDAVTAVAIPTGDNVTTALPIATVRGAPNAPGATAFRSFVLSNVGRSVLTAAGFLEP